jgi:hypothetical protein
MKLTSRDMARARVMLRDQSKGEDPYDLLDDEGDPENRDKRRVLIIWCLRSRTDPEFTWDQAWDVPFSEVYADDDDEDEQAPPTPGPEPSGTGSGGNGNAKSSRKRPAAEPALNSSSSSG